MEQAAVRRMTASDSRMLREALLERLENPVDFKEVADPVSAQSSVEAEKGGGIWGSLVLPDVYAQLIASHSYSGGDKTTGKEKGSSAGTDNDSVCTSSTSASSRTDRTPLNDSAIRSLCMGDVQREHSLSPLSGSPPKGMIGMKVNVIYALASGESEKQSTTASQRSDRRSLSPGSQKNEHTWRSAHCFTPTSASVHGQSSRSSPPRVLNSGGKSGEKEKAHDSYRERSRSPKPYGLTGLARGSGGSVGDSHSISPRKEKGEPATWKSALEISNTLHTHHTASTKAGLVEKYVLVPEVIPKNEEYAHIQSKFNLPTSATLLGQREKYSPPAPLPRTFSPTRARDTEKEAEALKERFAHLQSKLYSPTENSVSGRYRSDSPPRVTASPLTENHTKSTKPARAAHSLSGKSEKGACGDGAESAAPVLRRGSKSLQLERHLKKNKGNPLSGADGAAKEVKEPKPRESIRKSLILMKKEIDSSVLPGEHIMEVKVKEPKGTKKAALVDMGSIYEAPASFFASLMFPSASAVSGEVHMIDTGTNSPVKSTGTSPVTLPVLAPSPPKIMFAAIEGSAKGDSPAVSAPTWTVAPLSGSQKVSRPAPTPTSPRTTPVISSPVISSTTSTLPPTPTWTEAPLAVSPTMSPPAPPSTVKAVRLVDSPTTSTKETKTHLPFTTGATTKVVATNKDKEDKCQDKEKTGEQKTHTYLMKSQTDAPVVEVREVKPRASIRASLILMKDEIDPKIAPGEHIMEVKVKEPKAPVAPAVVEVKEVKEVKPRESIRKSLLLIKEEIDPKIAPGEHIMEVKVKEPKAPVAPAVVEVKEMKEVKPRESIRKSLLLIKEEIDPKIAPGEHIMEVKVKEPKAPVAPAVVEVKEVREVKPRESIRASLILMKKDIDPSVAPGEHIMEVKVKEPPSSISSLSVSPAATLSTTKACDSALADPLSGTSASTITSAVTGAGVSQPAGATSVIKIDGTSSPDNTSITTLTTTSSAAVIVDAKPAALDTTVAPTEPSTGVMDWMKNLF